MLEAVAFCLDGKKHGPELAERLKWTVPEEHRQDLEMILRLNHLAPACKVEWEAVLIGQIVICEHLKLAFERTDENEWLELPSQLRRHTSAFGDHKALRLVPIEYFEPKFKLYFRIDDALCDRRSMEHIFGIDWVNNTKRYICASQERFADLVNLLFQRPLCDQSLYTTMLGAFGTRILQLDVEACLLLNPHLADPEAQKTYMDALLSMLYEFLMQKPRSIRAFGSDETKFSCRTYVELPLRDYKEHDDKICAFLEWLNNQGANADGLIIIREDGKTEKLIRTFALDPLACGRNRQMRVMFFSKGGKRKFIPDNPAVTVLDAIQFALPNDLTRPVDDWNRRRDSDSHVFLCHTVDLPHKAIVVKDTKGSFVPEWTFLYNYKELYKLLRNYKVKKDDPEVEKERTTFFWRHGDLCARFRVPHAKIPEVLRAQAHIRMSGARSFLHEVHDKAPLRPRRAYVDLDGTSMSPDEAARLWSEITGATKVSITIAPSKDGKNYWIHLVAVDIVVAGHEENKALRLKMKEIVGNCVDLNPQNLRMLGSDRQDAEERVLQWEGLFCRTGDRKEITNETERQLLCSTFPPDEHPRITVVSTENVQKKKKGSGKTKGVPFDPNNDQHQFMAEEAKRYMLSLGQPFEESQISSIERQSCSWILWFKDRFCEYVHDMIESGEKDIGSSRKSSFHHISHHAGLTFTRNWFSPTCFDSDCAKIRNTLGRKKRYEYSGDHNILFI